jgi:hypothetical protein
MRSQLDCHDSRLPGTGVFDIKTRACLPIRLDLLNFEVSQPAPMSLSLLIPLNRRTQDILFALSSVLSKASRRNIMI